MCMVGQTREQGMMRLTGAMAAKNGDTATANSVNAAADRMGNSSSVLPPVGMQKSRTATRPASSPTILGGPQPGKTLLGQ